MSVDRIQRSAASVSLTIAESAALSDAFNFSQYAGMIIIMPAAWTAASLGFQVSDSSGGTFTPLYGDDAALVEISGPVASRAYNAPAAVFAGLWVKLWSQTSASGVNQAAARTLSVHLKG